MAIEHGKERRAAVDGFGKLGIELNRAQKFPIGCHTPRQKSPMMGGRAPEFRISVPSLCHCWLPASISFPPLMAIPTPAHSH